MKTLKYLGFIVCALLIFVACTKELSLETGFSGAGAVGYLGSVAGQCDSSTEIRGHYIKDSVLDASSYVVVNVFFQKTGSYKIVTETENGFSFYDSGYMINTGLQPITLKAVGRPIATRNTNFLVTFDTSFCSFTIPVLDSANTNAHYYLDSASGCGTISGNYRVNTTLNLNTNIIVVPIKVTLPGDYNIQTIFHNGMRFSASGQFGTIGVQNIALRGTGAPIVSGNDTIRLSINTATCSYPITVLPDTTILGGPTAADSAWSFNQGAPFFFGPTNLSTIDTLPIPAPPNTLVLNVSGDTYPVGDSSFIILLPYAGLAAGTTYNTNTNAYFSFENSSGVSIYSANPITPTVNVAITVTTYDITTKVIKGTFTGTAENASAASVPITTGKFTAALP